MHATDFGRTLIIANPAAQSGAAREVAERLQRFLDMTARASQFDLVLTGLRTKSWTIRSGLESA